MSKESLAFPEGNFTEREFHAQNSSQHNTFVSFVLALVLREIPSPFIALNPKNFENFCST